MKINETLLLDNPETLWVVQSGKLALFATTVKDGSVAGHRRYLFSVNTNEALFGTLPLGDGRIALQPELRSGCLQASLGGTHEVSRAPDPLRDRIVSGKWVFQAVAVEPTKLIQLPMSELEQRIAASEPEAITLVENWVYNLGQAVKQQQTVLAMPLNLNQTKFERSFSLSPSEELQIRQKEVFWVKFQQGNACWLGIKELTLNSASPVCPLTAGIWLEAEDTSVGTMLSTVELEPDQLQAGLASLHTYLFFYFSLLLNQEAEAEHRRFQEREQLNRQVAAGALGELAAVLQPQQEAVFFQEGPPLLVAMGAIGRVLGITIHPAADDLHNTKDPVTAIACASQIRTRRITLADDWWHREHGPLLAFTQWEKRPVALLPIRGKGYELFDPTSQTRTFVTKSVSKTLSPQAYVIYRPLPQVINNAIDLLRFGTKGIEKDIASIFFLGIIGTLLGMITPQATAILVNQAIPDSDRSSLWQIGLVLLAMAFAQLAFSIAQSIVTLRVQSLTDSTLQPALWDRLLRLSPAFFRQYTSGDLVRRVMSVKAIQQKLNGATQRTLLSGIFALFNLILMFAYSWQLALVGMGLGLLASIITLISSFFLVKKSRQQQEVDGAIYGLTIQLINGVTKLRVAMAEERAFAAWAKKYTQRIRLKASVQQIVDLVSVFNEALPLVSSAMVFGFAITTIQTSLTQTSLTIGTFVAFNYALGIFIKGVIDLSNTITDIWSIIPLWERTQPILRSQPESDTHKEHPGTLIGRIRLNHVSFRYSEDGPLILNDISLNAEPGEFIAIVGPSGSGKSTILRLLLGFETPTIGSVFYDGHDLARLDLQALRKSLGAVLQNGKIGSGSIFENITGGALVTLEEVWEAARMAGLADDIEQMPMGMHTIISEGGGNLSGGQRQRLLIARSLVCKPKVILMDEATSALDNRTQAIVSASLDQLQATRVVIAHRLSTICNADRIYVIDAGRVVQVGTFSQLISQEGLFARLVARQSILFD
ncbi:NHLP bacteriocin export ABC transporter permease/ATPase subunit [Nostocales cyanobacterium HT-58-2]|nr:NHLP bacteriocin export ABC transporter permease/ATPase subunit [Nostocales cyanobacterium HT-58-2]